MFVCRNFWKKFSLPAHDFGRGGKYKNVSVREMRDKEKRNEGFFWDWARYAFRG